MASASRVRQAWPAAWGEPSTGPPPVTRRPKKRPPAVVYRKRSRVRLDYRLTAGLPGTRWTGRRPDGRTARRARPTPLSSRVLWGRVAQPVKQNWMRQDKLGGGRRVALPRDCPRHPFQNRWRWRRCPQLKAPAHPLAERPSSPWLFRPAMGGRRGSDAVGRGAPTESGSEASCGRASQPDRCRRGSGEKCPSAPTARLLPLCRGRKKRYCAFSNSLMGDERRTHAPDITRLKTPGAVRRGPQGMEGICARRRRLKTTSVGRPSTLRPPFRWREWCPGGVGGGSGTAPPGCHPDTGLYPSASTSRRVGPLISLP
jgi:hypothetical protein